MEVGKDGALRRVGGPPGRRVGNRALETGVLAGAGLTLWRGTTRLFEGLSFELPAGAALLIEGPNGAGKTTLLRVIAGLTLPESGSITWRGSALKQQLQAGSLRLAFAGHALALKGELSTRENLQFFARLSGTSARVGEMLGAVGLAGFDTRLPRTLSGGQLQRVAIARALVHRPPLVLADEPTGNLDPDTAERVMDLLAAQVRAEGAACVLVTHSKGAAARADRVLRLSAHGIDDA